MKKALLAPQSMKDIVEPRFGLRLEPRDKRNFQLGAIEDLPPLEELPDEYRVELPIKDQQESDFCTGMVASLMSGAQEGVELSPEWWFAMSKRLSGRVSRWGQSIHYALMVGIEYGAVEKAAVEWNLRNKDISFLRDPDNWPEDFVQLAKEHLKEAYFEVSGPYDHFDNARVAMWKYQDEKRILGLGLKWGWSFGSPMLVDIPQQGAGHMIAIVGWKLFDDEQFIDLQNSYGVGAGDGGHFYMNREVFNHYADKYGVFMYKDMPEGMTKEEVIRKSQLYQAGRFDKAVIIIKALWQLLKSWKKR